MALRRSLLCLSLAVVVVALSASVEAERPSVGAIRWDAWYWDNNSPYVANRDIVGRVVTVDVSDKRWHYRVPYYGRINNDTSVTMGLANTTAAAQQQNRYAQSAGINYWAFCVYPLQCKDYHPPDSDCPEIQCCADNYALSYGLERYLDLPQTEQSRVNFTLILQGGNWFPGEDHGSVETLAQEAARYAKYFQMSTYHKVLNGRPLVYILGVDKQGRVKAGIQAINKAAAAASVAAPYYVLMDGSVQGAIPIRKEIGAQALSSYVLIKDGSVNGLPFEANMNFSKQWWQDAAQAGEQVVPPITAGWDNRPRQLVPMPWPNGSCKNGPGNCFVQDPTMPQLTQHVADAMNFTVSNVKSATEANTVVISAWDEFDEGHWICPSVQGGTEKIDAVKKAIDAFV